MFLIIVFFLLQNNKLSEVLRYIGGKENSLTPDTILYIVKYCNYFNRIQFLEKKIQNIFKDNQTHAKEFYNKRDLLD